jgi:hypothetical protein
MLFSRRLATIVAGVAVAAGVTGVAETAADAAAVRSVQADSSYTCFSGDLCVHYVTSSGSYHWKRLYLCQRWTIPGTATWYINNQTGNTSATFYYPYAASVPPHSKGRPPNYPYGPHHPAPQSVRNC